MTLHELSILNYKNIEQAELAFSPKLNCFIGHNGEGKTNLLDAIYYLSFCKSATNPIDAQVVRHGADFMMLQGRYETDDGTPELIDCGLRPGHRKRFKRNRKDYHRLAEHIGLIPLVMISPADSALIAGGSEERRRLMDVVISQQDARYLDALMRYNRALTQRNALLRAEAEPDPAMLDLYEEEMARHGEYLYHARTAFIETFTPLFAHYYSLIGADGERVALHYLSHGSRGPLLQVIRRDRAKDRAVGYSLHGIHRDDLEMLLGDYPIRKEGSQGQNKSYLVALKLAQFDFLRQTGRGTVPLLLLDDLFDKLDATRVERIVQLVGGEHFGQIFITDTNREHLDRMLPASGGDYKLFAVQGGRVTP